MRFVVLCTCLISTAGAHAQTLPAKTPPDHVKQVQEGLKLFAAEVRATLVSQCLDCHGGKRIRGDFDLSTRKKLIDSGAIGKTAKESKLIKLITHLEEPHMPHRADKLPEKSISAIARWIDLGAPYDRPLVEGKSDEPKDITVTERDRDFWSFRPLAQVKVPGTGLAGWVRTPIDNFIAAALDAKGLQPNPPADRRTLIRRAYQVLIGLPPTPEQVNAFIRDEDPNAYEKLIDRVLASPHYGERWARHWMDIARFAESHGYEQDYKRPFAFYYRDFLIKALNQDMPYDQFLRWQVAGDELAPSEPLALTATGFLGGGAFPTQLTEMEFESARYDELDDMANTTGLAMLGLSIGCARCHDHKYDPIPTHDYYRMVATFTTTIRSEIELPMTPGQKPNTVMVAGEGVKPMKHHADGRGFPHFYKETFFLKRGDVRQKQDVVQPGFLQVLMRNGKDETHWRTGISNASTRTSLRRSALANWLTDVDSGAGHLAARVIVNRLWQHPFGRGIVATPNDFGLQGTAPSHPELLDWLANDLIKNGWQLKRLHKLIMTSAVFMQNNAFDETRAKIDRDNVLLWRWTPRRLEAEPIRDSMLHVAGMLDRTMYGAGSLDENMRRRSVYFFIKRSELIPMMMLFDWPEHLVSIGQRSVTTTPTQALAFMNSPQGRQYAQGFASRLGGKATPAAVARGYQLAFGRDPTTQELTLLSSFVVNQAASYRQGGRTDAEQLALIDFCQTLLGLNEFIYIE